LAKLKELKDRNRFVYFLFAPHLEDGEKILFVAHRHPFLMFKNGLKITFFGFIIPIFFWNVFPEIWFVFLIWLLVGFIQINKMIFNWYFDSLLITSVSVIDVRWDGPFHRTSVRLEYSMIEGTTYSFQGILQTLFNYGNLNVNRQGGGSGLELKDTINPSRVESILMQYQETFLEDKGMEESKRLRGLLSELVARHVKDGGGGQEVEVEF